jgi:hypothetical protein
MWRLLSVLAVSGCLLAGLPAITTAQTNPGFTFNWGGEGPGRKQQLKYVLDYGTPNAYDRYRLKLGRQDRAISRIAISYPDYYTGKFDPKAIEVRAGGESRGGFLGFGGNRGKKIDLAETTWDRESGEIEIKPAETIPAGTPVEIVLSNVRNPSSGGMYYFNAQIESPGDLPMMRYVGTWVIGIFKS